MANLFLIKDDFKSISTLDQLDSITDGENDVWKKKLPATIEKVSSYLRFRYDVNKVFAPVKKYDGETPFSIGDRIYFNDTVYSVIQESQSNTPIEDEAFFKDIDDRNAAIKEVVIIFVLYGIYSRINGSEIPNWLQIQYDGGDSNQKGGALGFLKEIRSGKVDIDLPLWEEVESGEDQSGNNIAYGSATIAKTRNTSI